MSNTTDQIKELRSRTGCGIVDCQEALKQASGDIEKAITHLRKKGIAQAAKKAERDTQEGLIVSYIHTNLKLGVLVSLLCETDFVARNDKFQELAHNIALHIAAMDPLALGPDDIPAELLAEEKAVAVEQFADSGKPADLQEKIVEGKLRKFRAERALLSQPFVKDPSRTIQDIINDAIQELGENITVDKFTRLSI